MPTPISVTNMQRVSGRKHSKLREDRQQVASPLGRCLILSEKALRPATEFKSRQGILSLSALSNTSADLIIVTTDGISEVNQMPPAETESGPASFLLQMKPSVLRVQIF